CRSRTSCQQDTAQGCTGAAPDVCQHQVTLYVDTGYTGCLVISADGIQGFPETGLSQDEGCQSKDNQEYHYDYRDRADHAASQPAVTVGQVGYRTGGEDLRRCTADQLAAQSGDEGRHLGVGDQEALQGADDHTHYHTK